MARIKRRHRPVGYWRVVFKAALFSYIASNYARYQRRPESQPIVRDWLKQSVERV